jgi:predicted amidohydrolase YtcJ
VLIQRGHLLDGRIVDIRVDQLITAVAESLTPRGGEEVVDARGHTVIPGLHDHHVHLWAAAAALDSVDVGPVHVRGTDDLRRLLKSAVADSDGWIRAVGYHESAAGYLDRTTLDQVIPNVPVRIQHRSGALWILNSVGLSAVNRSGHPDGRVPSSEATWPAAIGMRERSLAHVSDRLTSYGVTGVTDATPDLDAGSVAALNDAHHRGELRQRVHCLSPGKRILHDDSLDVDGLTEWIAACHDRGVPVALHCVTRSQLVVALAALRSAGSSPSDRIEHAAVVPPDCLRDLAESGVLVVTQPNFVSERGDQYLVDVSGEELPALWPLASLLNSGVRVALSTDLPFGGLDPWKAIHAAVTRTTGAGHLLNPRERVSPHQALTMFFGTPQRPDVPRGIAAGQQGDLCLVSGSPKELFSNLDSRLVVGTVINGALQSINGGLKA